MKAGELCLGADGADAACSNGLGENGQAFWRKGPSEESASLYEASLV